jgi:hypothetical protein
MAAPEAVVVTGIVWVRAGHRWRARVAVEPFAGELTPA